MLLWTSATECETRRQRSSTPVLEQITRGDCAGIHVAQGCKMAIPISRSPTVTVPNLAHPVVSHRYDIFGINFGRL